MKLRLAIIYLLFPFVLTAQGNHPVPPPAAARLFYIQHSNNYNTYVYDANISGGRISDADPVKEYRIIYTEGGKIAPLTSLQQKFAYGMNARKIADNQFELSLAGFRKQKFLLTLTESGKPVVAVTVNSHRIFLDRMFLHLKDGTAGLGIKADYVLFFGRDYHTGKATVEKVQPRD